MFANTQNSAPSRWRWPASEWDLSWDGNSSSGKGGSSVAALRSTTLRRELMPSTSLVMLVALVTGCLYWAKPVLVPVALAVLITFVHGPVIATLERRGLPRLPAVLAVVGMTAFLVTRLAWLLIAQFLHFANQLPPYQANATRQIAEFR